LAEDEELFWDWLIESRLSPEVDTFNKRKEVDGIMRSLRNTVYFLFFIVNALFVTSIFMMTQVNEFKGNIQISIPCPNKDGTFEVEPISMIFIFTFGLTLLFQMTGMVIHRFYTFLHVAYDTKVVNIDREKPLFVCHDKDDMV
jgi:chitin synthase